MNFAVWKFVLSMQVLCGQTNYLSEMMICCRCRRTCPVGGVELTLDADDLVVAGLLETFAGNLMLLRLALRVDGVYVRLDPLDERRLVLADLVVAGLLETFAGNLMLLRLALRVGGVYVRLDPLDERRLGLKTLLMSVMKPAWCMLCSSKGLYRCGLNFRKNF